MAKEKWKSGRQSDWQIEMSLGDTHRCLRVRGRQISSRNKGRSVRRSAPLFRMQSGRCTVRATTQRPRRRMQSNGRGGREQKEENAERSDYSTRQTTSILIVAAGESRVARPRWPHKIGSRTQRLSDRSEQSAS